MQPRERMSDDFGGGLRGPPRHGFQGDRGAVPAGRDMPPGLTIALTREAGSRGGTVGRRVGQKLGWPVYDQELLEYMAHDMTARKGVTECLSVEAASWAEARLEELLRQENLSQQPAVLNLARVVLALGARGEVVLIGRGAGFILPPSCCLHVRIIAPLADRVAYMAQWLRLTDAEAAERVRLRDARRAEFLATHFRREPGEVYQYDLLLNSGRLGEDACTALIVQAAQSRTRTRMLGRLDEPGS